MTRALIENKVIIRTKDNIERDQIRDAIWRAAEKNKYYNEYFKNSGMTVDTRDDCTVVVESELYMVNCVRGITLEAMGEVLSKEE